MAKGISPIVGADLGMRPAGHAQRGIGWTGRRQPALHQRHAVDPDAYDFASSLRRHHASGPRRPRVAPARQRQVRVERPLLERNPQVLEAIRDMTLDINGLTGFR